MSKGTHVPVRRCAACKRVAPKSELIRLVYSDKQGIQIDIEAKRMGRGVYVCPSKDCVKNAQRRKSLERIWNTKVPEELFDRLLQRLEVGQPSADDIACCS